MRRGQVSVSLATTATSVRVVHSAHCPEIGPICAERDEPPQLHDQRFTIVEARLVGVYAVTEHLGVELQLPLKLNRTRVEYQRLDGTPFTPDYPNIHHRNETLWGLGDPWLLGRLAGGGAGITFTGRAGVSLPLGSTEPNPFELGEMGLEHQHVQLGTGTVDPILALEVGRMLGRRVRLAAQGQAQLVLYENGEGYRAGNRYAGGLQARVSVLPSLSISLTADLVNERAERWDGEVLQDGNLGRTDVLLGGGATYAVGGYALTAAVRVPVHQDIAQAGDEAGQLSYPAIVELTVGRTFETTE